MQDISYTSKLAHAEDGRPLALDYYIIANDGEPGRYGVKIIEKNSGGFVHTKWCGSLECEVAMKERAGVTSRCMPLAQSGTSGTCPVCGKACATDIIWGIAY